MTFQTIEQLLEHMPRDLYSPPAYACAPENSLGPKQDFHIDRFVASYSSLDFGWKAAKAFARSNRRFPSFLEGPDLVLFRAYRYVLGGRDKLMDKVIGFGTRPAMENQAMQLQAGIIAARSQDHQAAHDAVLDSIRVHMNVTVEELNAYERLFFNVLDRWIDDRWVRGLIYPETKLVEYNELYTETETVNNLVWRGAYNTGFSGVLRMLGQQEHLSVVKNVRDAAERLEAAIMDQGAWLANSGFLCSRHATPIHHGKQLLGAAKAGGQDTVDESPMPGFSQLMSVQLGIAEAHHQIAKQAYANPVVIDVDVEN